MRLIDADLFLKHLNGSVKGEHIEQKQAIANTLAFMVETEATMFEVKVPQWISCSEKLPEEYGEYLITWSSSCTPGRRFIEFCEYELTGEYDHENNRFRGRWLLGDNFKEYEDVRVIAWMEMPEAYREEE